MDAATIGEWSRYVVSGALLAFIVAWLAYCGEAGYRARERRAALVTAAQPDERDLVGVGATQAADQVVHSAEDDAAARLGRVGLSVALLATMLLGAGVLMRAFAVGRAPWGNMYEFSITGALVASVVFLGFARTRAGRALAVWLVLLVVLTVGMAATVLYVPPGPLVPALQSYLLVIHVGAAVLAFGLFTVAAAVSGLQIAAERAERRGIGRDGVLSAARLDTLSYRLIAVGFPVWTFGPLIMGAVWAEVSWGRYWGWDPKEVWALITWLAYAAYLHARETAGWRGTKASVVSLIGYATVLFSYFAVNIVFNGLHSYAQ